MPYVSDEQLERLEAAYWKLAESQMRLHRERTPEGLEGLRVPVLKSVCDGVNAIGAVIPIKRRESPYAGDDEQMAEYVRESE